MNFLLQKRREITILLFMCAIYFFSYFQRVAIPGTLFDQLQTGFSASASAIAALGSIFLYIYGGTQLFVGIMADRCGGARTLILGGLFMSIGAVLFPLSESLTVLYATRALVAAGSAMIFISLVKEVDELFESRYFAIVLGAAVVLGYSGGLAGTLPLDRAAAAFGWRNALLAAGILSAIVLIFAYAALSRAGLLRRTCALAQPHRFREIMRNPWSLPVLISGSVNFTIYFLFQATIGKKMLTDCTEISPASAASVGSLMMSMIMGMAFVSGPLSRAIGNRRKPILVTCTFLTLLATTGMTANMLIGPSPGMLSCCLAIISVAAGCTILFTSTMKEVNPPGSAGTSTGVLNAAAYLVVAVTTHMAGIIMDLFREQAVQRETALVYPPGAYTVILLCCAGMAAFSFISSLFIRETRSVSIYDERGPKGERSNSIGQPDQSE